MSEQLTESRDKMTPHIVPEHVAPTEREVPIRQFDDFAEIKNNLLFERAKGAMQITNKRLLYRSEGRSLLGDIFTHNEFNVFEIAGFELRNVRKFFPSRLVVSLILSIVVYLIFMSFGSSSVKTPDQLAGTVVCSYLYTVFCAFALFLKQSTLRTVFVASALGSLFGIDAAVQKAIELGADKQITDTYPFPTGWVIIVFLVWIFLWLLSGFRKSFSVEIKTKAGSGALMLIPDTNPYDHVHTTDSTLQTIDKLGAMINDLQTMGDLAIEKWQAPQQEKEN